MRCNSLDIATHHLGLTHPTQDLTPPNHSSPPPKYTKGNHNSQDVHEGEEAKTEDEGVGEVGQAQGVSNGGYACHCHSEARCEAPH